MTALPALAVVAVVAMLGLLPSCDGGPETRGDATSSSTATVTRAVTGTARCGDTQPGRYTTEVFEPDEVAVVALGAGRSADVHQPADDPAGCRPALVWVHGGGFTTGTRNGPAEQAWGDELARRGYVWVTIDYDLGEGPQFGLADATDGERAAVVDRAITQTREAVAWVRSRAGELGVDPERVAVGGTSAGAMIALGAGLPAGPTESAVCTVVSISGDVRLDWLVAGPASALFVHGDADQIVPFAASEQAAAALGAVGRTTALVPVAGAGHEIVGPPPAEVVDAAATWLGTHLAAGCG